MTRAFFAAAVIVVTTAAANPFAGKRLYVDPTSPARKQADAWNRSRPADAAHMRGIANQSQVIWFGGWTSNIKNAVDVTTSRIISAGALPVYAVYNIPHRDCGLYSAGGARSGDDYRHWIREFAKGLKGRPTVVILEPDAVPTNDCLPFRIKDERYVLLRDAAQTLRAANAAVYIDAGNANWHQPAEIADRLRKSGIDEAEGFALNIAKFQATNVNVAYGNRVSGLVDGKHFVIDTGRNGTGATNIKEWCNAPGQALGAPPTTDTRIPLVDAFLWIKTPGQSDGTCNGGPRAGEWWADYALELSKMADALKIGPR
ncbi:MAG TPA: glycoside hydrolase family 6 protein [Longimicrobiales bacterium]|nr:glycoside hydrolase family 6 protein [Longimicrobiales bacterium]